MAETTTPDPAGVLAELRTPEGWADPYPRYAAVREHAPALRTAQGVVVVGRYHDCQRVLRDPRFGKGARTFGVCGVEVRLVMNQVSIELWQVQPDLVCRSLDGILTGPVGQGARGSRDGRQPGAAA